MGDFAPFTGPLMKALQIKQMTDEIAYRREARAREQQAFQMHIEDRQHQQAANDFHTAMLLNQSGAMPVQSGLPGEFQAGLAGKGTVTAPTGQQYSMPTPEQSAVQAGRAKAAGQQAYEDIVDPEQEFAFPDELGGSKVKIKQSKLPEMTLKVQTALEKLHPDMTISYADNKQTGDRTYFGTDKRSGNVKTLRTIPGVAKGAASGAAKEALPDEHAIQEIYEGPPGHPEKGYLQNNLNTLTAYTQEVARGQFPKDKAGNILSEQGQVLSPEEALKVQQNARRQVEAVTTKARKAAENEAKARIRNSGVRVTGSQQSAPASPSAQPYAGKSLSRSKLGEAGARKRMSALEFEKQFTAGGGTITP